MAAHTQIEVLDLRHFNARQLRALLMEEASVWHERLRWDYTASTELLLSYLDSQILPGFVALLRGKVCGYCFCIYEGAKAVIGDVYVTLATPNRTAVAHSLIRHLLETLEASPGIGRIETQLLLFEPGMLTPAFTGFRTFPRLFLECALQRTPPPRALSAAYELSRWHASAYQATGELILGAYEGHIDAQINDQYRTLDGSLRFLHNIVRFPGCGVFEPESSLLLRDRRSGGLIAVLLVSRVDAGVAHVTQLCLAKSVRGAGLGASLLAHATHGLAERGYRTLTLTVSQENEEALRLYRAAGFHTRLGFDALVLDKAISPGRFVPIALPIEVPADGPGLFSFVRRRTTPARN